MDDYSGVDDENMGEADDALFSTSLARSSGHKLLLARRRALPAFHPLHERGLGVADGPRGDLDVGRPVAAHARLSQPREADFEQLGGFLGREQNDGQRGQLLRRRVRSHTVVSLWR
jgi:hypothetical protein